MGIFAGAQGMFAVVHSACGKIAERNYNRSMNANACGSTGGGRRIWAGGSRRAPAPPESFSAEVMLPESCDDVVCVLVSIADRQNEKRKDRRWSFFFSFFFSSSDLL